MKTLTRIVVVLACVACLTSLFPVSAAWAASEALTIDSQASLSPGRMLVTVSGTATCTAGYWADIFVEVVQASRGGSQATGDGGSGSFQCTGAAQAWTVQVEVDDESPLFKKGRASALVQFQSWSGCEGCWDNWDSIQRDALLKLQ